MNTGMEEFMESIGYVKSKRSQYPPLVQTEGSHSPQPAYSENDDLWQFASGPGYSPSLELNREQDYQPRDIIVLISQLAFKQGAKLEADRRTIMLKRLIDNHAVAGDGSWSENCI